MRRAIVLQKHAADLEQLQSDVYAARQRAAFWFEKEHYRTIKDFNFQKGNLVLVWNMKIEKSLNKKMKPRYLGSNIVILRNKGEAYIICELDGSVFHRLIAAFKVLSYFSRKSIPLPNNFLNINLFQLHKLKETELMVAEIGQKVDEEYDK